MSIFSNFVIVDDDPINNMICKTVIKKVIPDAMITSFTEPEKGIDYFKNEFPGNHSILFLDINMPAMTGWEFLDEFLGLKSDITNKVSVFILSSSVDLRDQERAESNAAVKQILSKPLTERMLSFVLESVAL